MNLDDKQRDELIIRTLIHVRSIERFLAAYVAGPSGENDERVNELLKMYYEEQKHAVEKLLSQGT